MNTLDFKVETIKNIDNSKHKLEVDKIKLETLLKCIAITSNTKIEHEYRHIRKYVNTIMFDTVFTVVSFVAGFWLLSQILDNIFS